MPWVGDEGTGSRGWNEEQTGESGWPGEEERWRGGNRGWEEDTQVAWADREVKSGRGRRSRWDTVENEERGRDRRSREGSRDKESRDGWSNHQQQHNSTDWEAAARNWMQHQAPVVEEPTPPELGSLLTRLGGGTDSETEGSRKLDLDTRLQMLMKDKSANMPAFLIGSDSSEDEAVPPAPPPPIAPPPPPPTQPSAVSHTPSPPLSRDPSPFLSHESYLESYHLTNQQEELERVNAALAKHPRGPSRMSDQMSLSPLSEDDGREILEAQPAPPFPGQPGFWPGGNHYQSQYSSQTTSWAPPGQWEAGREAEGSRAYWQYPPQDTWAPQNGQTVAEENVKEEEKPKKRRRRIGENPYKQVIEVVVKIVEAELKQILKRDINKRVCETYAFVLYDNWWMGEEAKHKEKLEREAQVIANDNRISRAPTITVPDKAQVAELPRIPKPEDLTSLIDRRREHLGGSGNKGRFGVGGGGSLGLGRLGVIPKIRKVQTKEPSPPPKSKERDVQKESKRESKKEKKREKEKQKEREKEEKKASPKKHEVETKASTQSVYKAIYSESDSDADKDDAKEEDDQSSSVVSSSESSESSDSSSDSSSESEEEDEKATGSKSKSQSATASSKSSSSASPSPSREPSPHHVSPPSSPGSKQSSSPPSKPPTPTLPPAVSPRRSALAQERSIDSGDCVFVFSMITLPHLRHRFRVRDYCVFEGCASINPCQSHWHSSQGS